MVYSLINNRAYLRRLHLSRDRARNIGEISRGRDSTKFHFRGACRPETDLPPPPSTPGPSSRKFAAVFGRALFSSLFFHRPKHARPKIHNSTFPYTRFCTYNSNAFSRCSSERYPTREFIFGHLSKGQLSHWTSSVTF